MAGTNKTLDLQLIKAPTLILVKPQMGENIGAAARIMLNFGMKNLRLVAPRDDWPNQKAYQMAAGAECILDQAKLFNTLEEALIDKEYVLAASARRRGLVKEIKPLKESIFHLTALYHQNDQDFLDRTAIVFGPEKSGLDNHDITLCNMIIRYQVNPGFGSLNLAQSIAIFCYEWYMSFITDQIRTDQLKTGDQKKIQKASRKEFVNMIEHLEEELEESGYFYPKEKKKRMMQNIQTALLRAEFTEQEVRTFRGIIKALSKGRGARFKKLKS